MKKTTYKQAGVDIDAGDALVERIKPFVKKTHRSGVMGGLGGFGAMFDLNKAFDLKKAGYKQPILVSSTDGVGTKLKIAQEMKIHNTIGIDLVAMCVNDLVVQGADPLFFLDYFATGELNVDVAEQVIKGIADGCKLAGCALVGGETAEMPGMYKKGEYDLAGFAVGAVERRNLLPKKNIQKGDIVLGLASSGVHSNGFSLVRHIMKKEKLTCASPAPFAPNKMLGEVLLNPTKIYVQSCLRAIREYPEEIKALAHITGGGLVENIPRVIPDNMAVDGTNAVVAVQPVFKWLQEAGNISHSEMVRTFNYGVGMVMVVSKLAAPKVKKILEEEKETVFPMGVMAERVFGNAVIIRE